MKKLLLLFITFALIGTSCQEEFDPGETNTAEFAGEWYYQLQGPDGTVIYPIEDTYIYEAEGYLTRLLSYNTSSNKKNLVWFDDQEWSFPMKAKFNINGAAGSFTAPKTINEYVLANIDTTDVADEDMVDGKQVTIEANDDYYLAEILEGKILKDAATVWPDKEQAKADSIYVKFAFHGANLNFTVKRLIKVDTVDRVIPTTPPTDSAVWDTSFVYTRNANFFEVLDPQDTLIIQGHRQTGWEVDFKK